MLVTITLHKVININKINDNEGRRKKIGEKYFAF